MTSWLPFAYSSPAAAQGNQPYPPIITTAPGQDGINVAGGQEPVEIAFSTVETRGGGADGIEVDSLGPVTAAGFSVLTRGEQSRGVVLSTRDGPIEFRAASVTTTSSGSDAILIDSGRGRAILQVTDITAAARGIVINGSGAVAATIGRVASAGAGITITGGSDATDLNFGAVTTQGADAAGISVRGGRRVTVAGGDVITSGGNATAVTLTSTNGPVEFRAGTVSATGPGSDGIVIDSGTGGATLQVSGVNAAGRGVAIASTGLISAVVGRVTSGGPGVTIAGGASPIDLNFGTVTSQQAAAGGITVTGAGRITVAGTDVATAGAGARAVTVTSGSGPVEFRAGTVRATGAGSDGVALNSGSGLVTLQVLGVNAVGRGVDIAGSGTILASVGQVAAGGPGVTISGGAAPIDLNFGTVTTQGAGAGAIAVRGGSRITVAGGDVATAGNDAAAVTLTSPTGPIEFRAGTISATGAGSDGILIDSGPGAATLQALGVTAAGRGVVITSSGVISANGGRVTSGATGVTITGGAAPIDFNFQAVTTQAAQAGGIAVSGSGRVTVAGGDVVTTGIGARAVTLTSSAGPVEFRAGTVQASGAGSDGIALNSGSGASTLQVLGVNATGRGVDITGLGVVLANVGQVAAGGPGVAITGGAGSIDLNFAGISTTAAGAAAIAVTGAGRITVAGTDVATAGDAASGVALRSTAGPVEFRSGSVRTTGAGANAIAIDSGTGAATLQVLDVNAAARGIDITGSGAITAVLRQVATGPGGGPAVIIKGGGAPIEMNFQTVSTQANGAGGIAVSGTGRISVGGTAVVTSGNDAPAVTLASTAGPVEFHAGTVRATGARSDAVTINSGSGATILQLLDVSAASGKGVGITGSGAITAVVGSVSTGAGGGNGITIAGGAGPIEFNFQSVNTRGSGAAGIAVAGSGPMNLVGNIIATAGASAPALSLMSGAGAVNMNLGNLSATGAGSSAIQVAGGTGAVTLQINNASAADRAAVDISSNGAINVRAIGTVTSGNGAAIRASTGDTIAVRTERSLVGTGPALDLSAGRGSTVNIGGTLSSASGLVLRVRGGGSTIYIEDTGRLTDRFDLSEGADLLTNLGLLQVAAGSTFGAGTDTLANAGTLRLAPSGGLPVSATLDGLELTRNTGLIDLGNQVLGDVLRLPGDYVGAGAGRVRIDLRPDGSGGDQLVIGGRASGSTVVELVGFQVQPDQVYNGINLIQAGAGSDPRAFRLPDGLGGGTLIETAILYNPAASSFALYTTPTQLSTDLSHLAFSVRQSFYRTTSGVAAAWRDARYGDDPRMRGGLWGQFRGSDERFDRSSVASPGPDVTQAQRLDETAVTGQLGYTFGLSDHAAIGVTAGYSRVDGKEAFSPATYQVDSANAGVSAHLRAGIGFLDLLGIYERHWIDFERTGGFGLKLGGESYGARAEAGARIRLGRGRLQLSGALDYGSTSVGTYRIQDSEISFDGGASLRGSVGVRASAPVGRLLLFGELRGVHEFEGEDGVTLRRGAVTGSITSVALGDYGVASAGFELRVSQRLSLSAAAESLRGDDYRSTGGRVAVRLDF